ncbi:MAG: hypothetical protein WKF75_05885 [Singulisphaera sp.]
MSSRLTWRRSPASPSTSRPSAHALPRLRGGGLEAELADFRSTDVDVPATLTADGKTYPGVGVHFRGFSSYMGVREGISGR